MVTPTWTTTGQISDAVEYPTAARPGRDRGRQPTPPTTSASHRVWTRERQHAECGRSTCAAKRDLNNFSWQTAVIRGFDHPLAGYDHR
jgi:hypothetical protein